ncbi:nuclear transport factor 2 family protein [Oceanobacillus jeddahense]|uniref:nuclear transport factor 2 family protein n=1 Tax=Oceanobacillus jeddahense TaxID=1462527 RepID=UPI000595E06A|nr:nuclear transport factor 2 family protein [Oceanobacillus jeddahense]
MSISKQQIEKINTAFAKGDMDFIFDLAAKDIVMNEVGHGITKGKAAFMEKMEPMRGYKAEVYQVYRTLIDGDTAVVEGEMQFTNEDGLVTYYFNDWYTFKNEKLKNVTAYMIKQTQSK